MTALLVVLCGVAFLALIWTRLHRSERAFSFFKQRHLRRLSRYQTDRRDKPPHIGSAFLFIVQPGDRADRLVACVRARVAPFVFRIHGPESNEKRRRGKPQIQAYLFLGRPGQADIDLPELLTQSCKDCDSRWRDFAHVGRNQITGGGGGGYASASGESVT